jgi:2,4-dienoyl-CoA reductase-like NADH-dependent reductase (Old Yellow Enzyme family)
VTEHFPHLFAPGSIGGVAIRNRVVQLPMGTGLVHDGRVTERDVALQEERARGGVGLIITGSAHVHPTSRFPARILTEAWDEDGIDLLSRRVEAVKRHGARIFGQLQHLGREAPGGLTETLPLAPSPIPSPRVPGVPHEMSAAEIRMIVDAYGRSARNFKAAGYDGVEIHGAHGYLVAQFVSPASNRRTDAYRGDSLDGRLRFLREIVEEIRACCGADFPLGIRLSASEQTSGGLTLADTLEIVDALQTAAPVDYLSITAGVRGGYVKDSSVDEGFALGFAEAVKQGVDVPVIVAGRIRHPHLAEQALAAGQADFVGLARAQLADPEWANKAREGRAAEIRPCIGFVQDCRRYAGGVTCAINPRVGREGEWGPPGRAASPRRVVVMGGGPAGLEAARVAAEAGHEVVLFEQADRLGGQLRLAAAGPTREELLDFVFYLERELARLGVDVRAGVSATREAVLAEAPDLCVCATGASPLPPEFPVDGGALVVTVWDLLGGAVKEVPDHAVVVDDGSGFWHGISAAELLAERGAAVKLLTSARAVGLAIPEESVANVMRRLGDNGVRFRPLVAVASVVGTTVSLADVVSGEPSKTTADLVVVTPRLRAEHGLLRQLEGRVPVLVAIGDCAAPRRLNHAVLEANLALRRFEAGQLGPIPLALF